MSTETPYVLIEALRVQYRYVEGRLRGIQAQEACLQGELGQLRALLVRYEPEAPEAFTVSPARDAGDVEVVSATLHYAPAETAPEPAPAPEEPPDLTLPDYIDAVLRKVGPCRASQLKRFLREQYDLTVPDSTLYETLHRGRVAQRYAQQKNQMWRVASPSTSMATQEEGA